MEAGAGVAAGRGGSLPMPSSSSTTTTTSSSSSSSQSLRKEWRAVSEHSVVRNASNEELERSKLGQSDERTIYEQGTVPLDVDFSSIAMMNGSLENDLSQQQRLNTISRQREELQQMEIELRAQFIARSEVMALQSSFDAQIKEHVNVAANLKEQLQEREQTIRELELKMEEKERELRAVKIDNEAAWAKEDLLREQNKELASFRRERDNSEAERGQHLKQIHDLKEHIQVKESQFLELEEQNRVAQETILYKDEQLREAQTWIARVQEMDALQLTTNHSLQSELRERTEQFNQFWLGCQRQFADMERHHLQAIQQLQLELAEARERSGVYTDESYMVHANTKEASTFGQNKGTQLNDGATLSGNTGVVPNGNVDDFTAFASTGNGSTKTDQVSVVPVVPSSMFGIGAYVPPGQVTALHPFVMHQQGVPSSVPSANVHIPQSHMGHFQSMPAISSHPQWQNQQAVSEESSQISSQSQYQLSQTEENLLGSGAGYEYELSANGHILQPDHLEANISPSQNPDSVITASNEEGQVLQSNGKNNLVPDLPQQNFQEISQFHAALRLDSPENNSEPKVRDGNVITPTNHSLEGQGLTTEQRSSTNTLLSDIPTHPVDSGEALECNTSVVVSSEASFSAGRTTNLLATKKIPEPTLLDERALLACIVRAIPAGSGGRIRISSTLPNRLGKMLAPLHWHDYKKTYGKLDDFVAGHPELFVIDGDFIHLREGAQEIISATAAVAKVAAAAAASAPYSSLLPSVAVTPMAQSHRLKKVASIDSKPVKIGSTEPSVSAPADVGNKPSHNSALLNQHSNGVSSNVVHGLSNVKILSKPKDPQDLNGVQSESRPDHSSVHMAVGNGATPDRAGLPNLQMKGSSNGRHGTNFAGKQQGRVTGAALTSRR
ncbi:hypothetical protein BVC80_1819g95 [Macleaya cordata]|uniref:DUF7725 domain-containing protein n=1 Tax=Macleaya cordata TaxID=56857 RepID=A0A200QWC5_MACCD|nr:hypothetical protein BVC80_1819g95 [Macleaya cordata]